MGFWGASWAVEAAHTSQQSGQRIGLLDPRSAKGLDKASVLRGDHGQGCFPEELRPVGSPTTWPWIGHNLPFLSPFPNLNYAQCPLPES